MSGPAASSERSPAASLVAAAASSSTTSRPSTGAVRRGRQPGGIGGERAPVVAVALKARDELRADESARAGDEDLHRATKLPAGETRGSSGQHQATRRGNPRILASTPPKCGHFARRRRK